ncbi:ABC transporter permease [Thauera linaloolentis]|uniref:Binding-protein-dependent transport system inner membrane protein n=1 Tax=Thauera linaloolentis (strain DSM 12138 / JCM 21573 / CCUG 41526 / CIP 105981 / IAM 15112 / NBRC 102519 / 47Lol) TaxID=1123367 RepID=N6YQL2_THAL4|nr:ABC transporter permease [Thauera linaloolentis]ENO84513.1 binding-protein-dependent transport system inner membrane protein [Thauera linaloolentis 47Lol = DSM 12138]MCM8565245.1 ABC transporter permease [Thauera linaloolentis]
MSTAEAIDGGVAVGSAGRARLSRVHAFLARRDPIGLILPALILAVWQVSSSRGWVDPVFLPEPRVVAAAFWKMLTEQNLAQDFVASVTIVGQAFIYGALAAVVLGIAAGLSRRVERFFGPTFDTIRHIPGIAWLPLIVLWLGLGAPAKILVIAKSVFFPVFLNTLQGIRNVDKAHIELAQALTLTRWQLVRKVVIPSAIPNVMVSLRYAAGLAWALVVVAEGLSGLEGLGFLIFRAQGLLLTDQLLVCMVIIGLVGFLIDRSMYQLQRRVLRWKQGFEG